MSDDTTMPATLPSALDLENLSWAGIPLPPGMFCTRIVGCPGRFAARCLAMVRAIRSRRPPGRVPRIMVMVLPLKSAATAWLLSARAGNPTFRQAATSSDDRTIRSMIPPRSRNCALVS